MLIKNFRSIKNNIINWHWGNLTKVYIAKFLYLNQIINFE